MKTKERTVYLRRARQDKVSRIEYFEKYLPASEFTLLTQLKHY
jgi:hypothetical protein